MYCEVACLGCCIYSVVLLIHCFFPHVRAGLRTCSWLCADAQYLQCLLCCTRLAEPAERSCLVSRALSCPVVSSFLRRLSGEAAGHVKHVGRCQWARGCRVTTSYCMAHRVSLFAVSRLLRCVALWRTLGRHDSLSSNVVFGRERRTPHLARRSRQLIRQYLRSRASPGCLS